MRCPETNCGWQAIAASESAAQAQLSEHLVDEHTESVDADIPDGKVQVRSGDDDEWLTMTVEQAAAYHDQVHDADD